MEQLIFMIAGGLLVLVGIAFLITRGAKKAER